ncbi:MAG: CPBP family intramembrane glutamic endopeptidase [Pseudomonadota bacterium]
MREEESRFKMTPELWVVSIAVNASALYWYHGRKGGLVDTASALGFDVPAPETWGAFLQCGVAAILLGVLPVLGIALVLKSSLKDLGFGAGDWRWGAKASVPAALGIFPLIVFTQSEASGICTYYPLTDLVGDGAGGFLAWEATYLVYYIAWEGLFRGAIQIGLGDRWGFAPAAALQTALTTMLHAGHPEAETLAACAVAPILGWIAWRSRSIWPVVLIHFAAGAGTDLGCLFLNR